jgi:hypothetical protein
VALVINPAASRLGVENAVLWGRGNREYYVHDFPGPLSIKAVLRGQVEWRAGTKAAVESYRERGVL